MCEEVVVSDNHITSQIFIDPIFFLGGAFKNVDSRFEIEMSAFANDHSPLYCTSLLCI